MLIGKQEATAISILGYGFVMGGYTGSYLKDCDRYDPNADSWAEMADMSTAKSRIAASTIYL
jgi:hypothetical protein